MDSAVWILAFVLMNGIGICALRSVKRLPAVELRPREYDDILRSWHTDASGSLMTAVAMKRYDARKDSEKEKYSRCFNNADSLSSYSVCMQWMQQGGRSKPKQQRERWICERNKNCRLKTTVRHRPRRPANTHLPYNQRIMQRAKTRRMRRDNLLRRRFTQTDNSYQPNFASTNVFDEIRQPQEEPGVGEEMLWWLRRLVRRLQGEEIVDEVEENRVENPGTYYLPGKRVRNKVFDVVKEYGADLIEKEGNFWHDPLSTAKRRSIPSLENAIDRDLPRMRSKAKAAHWLEHFASDIARFAGHDNITTRVLSPRFFDDEEPQSNVKNILSPSIFGAYNASGNVVPLEKLLQNMSEEERDTWKATMKKLLEGLKTTRSMKKKMIKSQKSKSVYSREDFKRVNHGSDEALVRFETLYANLTDEQWKHVSEDGYFYMTEDQIEQFYSGLGLDREEIDNMKKFVGRKDRDDKLYDDLATLPYDYDSWKIRSHDVVGTKLTRVNLKYQRELVSQPIRRSPLVFSPLVHSPSVKGPLLLSPLIFSPVILSPRVMSPFIVSPGVGNPFVLSPSVLHPFILSPQVLNPFVLAPLVLSPLILSPGVMMPIVLSPLVLSPIILSPQVLSSLVLSPCVLSPILLSPLVLTAVALSPCILSGALG